jgi:hypothetical protein
MADDKLKEAKDAFQDAQDAEQEDRTEALDDLKFARLGEQWPENVRRQRTLEGRPCLTINKMPAFIRQVVNDARQNKPSIKVHPVDDGADKETADVLNGLIRNIEYTSNADVAYDTATECAVGTGVGYFKMGLEYAHEDTFDLDIRIERVSNPFSIYRDPASTAADSSDWNSAFEVEMIPKVEFKKRFPKAKESDWDAEAFKALTDPWATEGSVMVAGWWKREEYDKKIYLLSDGTIQPEKQMQALQPILDVTGIQVMQERVAKCYRVYRCLLSGVEILEEEEFPGQYIPIIPVYGDEVDVEGKRHFRSLIRDAKDAQRMFNYWRTTTTELVALAPKTPFIGPVGAFDTDAAKWATANTQSHPYIEFDVKNGMTQGPQRQPFVSVPAGALQEALNASDDMKAIMGLYDASLGARSNETSGSAIMARQREGDVSTFHFQDNMARAIRHAGRVILGLIPHVYTQERMIRVIGEDGSQEAVKVSPQAQPQQAPTPQAQDNQQEQEPDVPVSRIYNLTVGKYDVTVTTGPSFTTRREEAAMQMTEFIRAFPQAAPVIGDLLASNLDWPGADEIAERLKTINPALQGQNIPPEVQQQIQEGQQMIQELGQENQELKMDQAGKQAEMQVKQAELQVKARELDLKEQEIAIKAQELQIEAYRAETERMHPKMPAQPKAAA